MTGAVLSYKKENIDKGKHVFKIDDIKLFSESLSEFTGIDFSKVVDGHSLEIEGLMHYLSTRKDELQTIGLGEVEIRTFLTLIIIGSFSLWLGFQRGHINSESLEKSASNKGKIEISPISSKDGATGGYSSCVIIPTNLSTMDKGKLNKLLDLIESLNLWENLKSICVVGKIPNSDSTILGRQEKVKIVSVKEDRGPAMARNVGIEMALEAGVDVLVFMDDDVINPINDDFKTICNDAIKATNFYCPKVKSYGDTCFDMFHDLDGTLNGVYESNSQLTSLVYGTTCVMIAPRMVFESGLRFDECFPLAAGEDIDFCVRAKSRGFRILPADELIVKHDYGYGATNESLIKFVSRFIRYGEGNRLIKERQPEYFNSLTVALRRTTPIDLKKKWIVPESIETLSTMVGGWFSWI